MVFCPLNAKCSLIHSTTRQSLGEQESRIWFAWHSFYRKKLESRIREDEKANTGRFWELLTIRVNGL
jgi:hypothetical protein